MLCVSGLGVGGPRLTGSSQSESQREVVLPWSIMTWSRPDADEVWECEVAQCLAVNFLGIQHRVVGGGASWRESFT